MTPRRRRILTSDERALWAHVTRHIAPLAPLPAPARPDPSPPSSAEPPPAAAPAPTSARAGAAVQARPPAIPATPAAPPLVPLERRLRQRLSRGSHPIDAVIDLHGLRQAEAHDALRSFLQRAQARDHKIVLVVTGKGAGAVDGGLFEERGVLRRAVPHWLRMPDLRGVVAGFEEAVQHHGGAGALYVRLRRHRAPGQTR